MKPFKQNSKKQTLHSMDDLPVLCTCTDAALLLRCTPEAIARMARGGVIPAVKRGNTWLFQRADLQLYVNSLFKNRGEY